MKNQRLPQAPWEGEAPAESGFRRQTGAGVLPLVLLCWLSAVPASARAEISPNESAAQTALLTEATQRTVKLAGAGLGRVEAYGSGVMVSPKGLVLTVLSALLDTPALQVTLANGQRRPARVVAANAGLGLALLQVEGGEALSAFDVAASAAHEVKPGDRVFALSNAFHIAVGDEPVSVQAGLVAGVQTVALRQGSTIINTPPLLLLDMTISNPGSPGGALIDSAGHLVGLLGREAKSSTADVWLNYAIPTKRFAAWVQAAVEGKLPPGEVASALATSPPSRRPDRRPFPPGPWRGFLLLPEILDQTPAYVDSVEPASPAAQAGLQADDLIMFVSTGGQEQLVQSVAAARAFLRQVPADKPVRLTVSRAGALLALAIPPVGNESGEGEVSPASAPPVAPVAPVAVVAPQATRPALAANREASPRSTTVSEGESSPVQLPEEPSPTAGALAAESSPEARAVRAVTARLAPSLVLLQMTGGAEQAAVGGRGTVSTGVIITADGWIVGSAFALAGKPAGILATLADGRQLVARLVAVDSNTKVMLLQVDAADLPAALVAPLATARVGQTVVALGRALPMATPFFANSDVRGEAGGNAPLQAGPLGDPTKTLPLAAPLLSVGMLSATNRHWGRALQTDARVSPVYYGGPLADLSGRVLGILTPFSPQNEAFIAGAEWYDAGIGFAVSLEGIMNRLPRWQQGDLQRGVLGVELASADLLSSPVIVGKVASDSPAAKAGLQAGDVLLRVDDKPLRRPTEFRAALFPHYAGDRIRLHWQRAEKTFTQEIVLGK